MTPMDIFDSMLESIQQFPLECNTYERENKRLAKDQDKYTKIFERLAFKLTAPEDKNFLKVKKRLSRTIKRKIKITEKFEEFISKHLERLQELIHISSIDLTILNINPLESNGPAVIKVGDTPAGSKKYCSCGDHASGMMICCDDPGCVTKWYHFKCLNMQIAPKTTWKCPKCLSIE